MTARPFRLMAPPPCNLIPPAGTPMPCGPWRARPLGPALIWLYRFARLRGLIWRLCLRFEGGPMQSHSWRQILQRHHGAKVGRYSYGDILRPGVLPPGSRVGPYCSVGGQLIVRRRDHPLDRPALHPFFYNAALGFLSRDSIGSEADNPLSIGADVWISDRVTILTGCHSIGHGAVIAAGAVVTRDVPAYALVAGVPARTLRLRFDTATIARLEASRWWERPLSEMITDPPVTGLLG